MTRFPLHARRWCAALVLGPAFAALLFVGEVRAEFSHDHGAVRAQPPPLPADTFSPMTALSRGRWPDACAAASRILTHRFADIEALVVFGLCAALAGDEKGTTLALARLREVETAPHFTQLVEGVRALKAGRRDEASAHFGEVLRLRGDDPLAHYFRGETFHAAGQDRQAIEAFESVLKTWPEHVPAMTAAARVLASTASGGEDMIAARDFAERATRADPRSQANWQLLAELCRRTGQSERAEAITLQWLRVPAPAR